MKPHRLLTALFLSITLCAPLTTQSAVLNGGNGGVVVLITSSVADTQAPSVPVGLSVLPTSATQVNVSWTAATDNVGVTSYRVYRDGVLVGSTSSVNFGDSGLVFAASYSYTVVACDAAANCSGHSIPIWASTYSNVTSLNFAVGWNLLGNSVTTPLDVATVFGDPAKVITVWKWIPATSKWAFYAPSMTAPALATYAAGMGYDVLTSINGGEGFWVNAQLPFSVPFPVGTAVAMNTFSDQLFQPNGLPQGWSLIAIGDNKPPKTFVTSISASSPVPGLIPTSINSLWAWDNVRSNWYFYAPSLENDGTLASYITSKNYLNFGVKTLDPSMGFWVNHP